MRSRSVKVLFLGRSCGAAKGTLIDLLERLVVDAPARARGRDMMKRRKWGDSLGSPARARKGLPPA